MKKPNYTNNLSLNNSQSQQRNNESKVTNNKIIIEKRIINKENLNNSKKSNATKNNSLLVISKKRAISTDKEDNLKKKTTNKTTALRSKSNIIENKFIYDNKEIKFIDKSNVNLNIHTVKKVSIKEDKKNISLINNDQSLVNDSLEDEIMKNFQDFLRLSSIKNKNLLELNQKICETKKKLHEKLIEQKICMNENQLLIKFTDNIKEVYEEIKNKQLIFLEDKEKFLKIKKIHNEKIIKLKEYYNNEMEKQRNLQENYQKEITKTEIKVRDRNFILKFF